PRTRGCAPSSPRAASSSTRPTRRRSGSSSQASTRRGKTNSDRVAGNCWRKVPASEHRGGPSGPPGRGAHPDALWTAVAIARAVFELLLGIVNQRTGDADEDDDDDDDESDGYRQRH